MRSGVFREGKTRSPSSWKLGIVNTKINCLRELSLDLIKLPMRK